MTERYCEGERFTGLSFAKSLKAAISLLRICGLLLYKMRAGSYHAERVQIRAV